jgi:hypothetical protein
MSHVLDRLIRRTRTATPAVEPLYQPRYQPHARAFAGMHAPAEGAGSFAGVLPESAEFVETISRSAEAGSAAGAAANSAARIELNRAAQLFEAGGQNLSTAGGDGKSAGRGRPGGYPTSGIREGIEGEGIEVRESGAPDAAEATEREGDRARNAHAAMQVAAGEESRANRAPESARPSPRRAAETVAQNSPEAPLDITISIGHIEVRSPQVSERPRRPAFRPKTSLADFLKPQQGGARE